MEDRESSVVSSVDFYSSDAIPNPPPAASQADGDVLPPPLGKRKADDDVDEEHHAPAHHHNHHRNHAQAHAHVRKRNRRASSPSLLLLSGSLPGCAGLPPQLWQHVFSFCSLADLGRLIQVNRSFHCYLTDVRSASTSKSGSGRLHLLKSESLWASARNALCTKPPKPLPGFTELQMWQLAWSKRCQFCNKLDAHSPGERIWQKGPGPAGVRVIWPFAIRACGPCLLEQCQTDASLLFSAASALRPALPFALLTNDQHYVPAYMLQSATTPAHVEIAKYYYKKHVDEITLELNDALSRGPAAAEEWSKGLGARGKERIKVAENWERWEARHQAMEEHTTGPKRAVSAAPSHAATSHNNNPSKSPPHRTPSPIIHAPVPASKYGSAVSFAARHGNASRHLDSTPPVRNLTAVAPSSQHAQARPPTAPPQAFTPSGQRNLHDANEAKATRKTDIERRCQLMDPPIAPNILRHMDSFKAAIQISQPMNDYAWSVLQPRLIAQLPAAQQAEADHVSRAASLPTKSLDRRHLDANSKEAKEAMDRDWEETQRPIRDRLDTIAEEYINRVWDHGQSVTHENSPKFAADLLAHVRRTFYAEKAESDATHQAQKVLSSTDNADSRPKLVLENMKWVYDNRIKPLTEPFRKDIFLCYGSGCEHNNKYYGFEGVVQHYGAKHTAAFSSGNVVVAWREAEWPEDPPFHPDPMSVKNPLLTHHPAATTGGYGGYYGGYSRAGTATPHMPTHLPQASPGPYNYGNQYAGPFAPPQMPPGSMNGLEYPQPYATPVDVYSHQAMGPPGYAAQNPYLTSPAMINNAIAPPPPPNMPPPGHGMPETALNGTEDTGQSTSSFDKQVSTVIEMTQDMWKRTSGIKDMPNSLRVYVLLHRVISKFHVEFNHEPNLNHFIDALSNHEIPKALRNAPGLSCKACQIGSAHHPTSSFYSKSEERITYTVLNLMTHFRNQHQPYQQPIPGHGVPVARLDWKENMIELPSERFISGLIHAPGMDDEKLLMIATVFPSLFPMPLPKIDVINSHGLASPASSGPKDTDKTSGAIHAPGESGGPPASSIMTGPEANTSLPAKPPDTGYDPHRSALSSEANDPPSSMNTKRFYREGSPAERRQHHYAEHRYYMPRDHLDDGYHRPREYVEYAPSPRIIHAGPAYDEYTGRRTAFREQERYYGPPEDIVYAHPREGSHGSREYSAYPRPVRYYEEDDHRPEYRYMNERPPQDASPLQGQSAADKFLAENEPPQPPPPPQPEGEPPAPIHENEGGSRYTPPPPDAPVPAEASAPIRPLGPPHPRAPSTVSNSSRFDDYQPNGHRMPMAGPSGPPPRRPGPQRRRDRPYEHRGHSRYQRYMSVARDDPYGRGSSMSRSQSRRYEEQRRRLDQETPQPNAEPDYEPDYSREHSIDQPGQDDGYYPHVRRHPRGYVSVQDRMHSHGPAYSPPRYRYDEPRGPQSVYVDEYGHPIHEYEVIRVRGDPRQRGPYMPHQPRYEPEPYGYVPVQYERPPHRYNSRPEEYVYYEERERSVPRRPVPEAESDVYEPQPTEIKVESVPVPMPPEAP
ncbi:hypothetical protein COCVIDRAFT_114729 [Bipolaris victoriae FI3]|uniref:DUF7892 domain-containing protein n=1 Tax=Bipolaris victoriae (strain FI3) TaxID=930091 RepID=W7E593_BIPV3|nr:hypothetical protein COCVIDRAFT_114729 [Bipolaris victoriae FI3]